LTWKRLNYDAKASQKTTRIAGMLEYADALTTGLWPNMDILPTKEQVVRGQRLKVKSMSIASSN